MSLMVLLLCILMISWADWLMSDNIQFRILPVITSLKWWLFQVPSLSIYILLNWTAKALFYLQSWQRRITLVQLIFSFSTFYWWPKWRHFKDCRPTPSMRWKQLPHLNCLNQVRGDQLLTLWPVSQLVWSHSAFTPLILAALTTNSPL